MTSTHSPNPNRASARKARVVRVVATVVAGFLVFFVANTVRADTEESASVSSQSLLTLPGSGSAAEPSPTPVATTAPVSAPTATAVPTATPLPTATPAPTPTPSPEPTATALPTATAVPVPTEEPAELALSVDTATIETATIETPTVAPEPTATPIPEPTATLVPEPTPTIEPFAAPVETQPTAVPTVEPTVAPPTAVPLQSVADLENYVLGKINGVRANAGLGPLALDPAISAISRDWSQQMAVGGFFSHRPGDELSAILPSGWRQWGENIASAPDIIYAQSSLEASPGHYANMVGNFTHVGIGVYSTGTQVWVTQNFARY